MQPFFKILAEGKDITDKVRDRLISIRVQDEAGIQSDTVTLALDNRGKAISLPRTGAELEVSIGYKENVLTKMGLFVVDELGISTAPDTLTIKASAANMKASMKEQVTRSWGTVTFYDVAKSIAEKHQLTAVIDQDLQARAYGYLEQTNESDLHFLTRLSRAQDVVFKIREGRLIVLAEGLARTVSGRELPQIKLAPGDVTSANATLKDRLRYSSVRARYHDLAAAKEITIEVGSGKPTFTLRRLYENRDLAVRAAKAKYARLERGKGELQLRMPGRPELYAETPLEMAGFGPGIDGDWTVKKATHTISSRGFESQITAELKT